MQVIYNNQTAEREKQPSLETEPGMERAGRREQGEEERGKNILCVILLKEAIGEQKGLGR